MKIMRKLLTLLITVTMVTTMIPYPAFAEVEEYTYINSVEINNLSMPVEGDQLDFKVSVPEGAHYHLATREEMDEYNYDYIEHNYNGVWWEKREGFASPYEIAESDNEYSCNIVLIPDDGYLFSQYFTGTVDGVEYEIQNSTTDLLMMGKKVKPAEPGFPISDYSKVNDALDKIPEDLFPYTAETVKALDDVNGNIRGGLSKDHQAEVDKMAEDVEQAVKALKQKEVISSVDINNIKTPVAGFQPEYDATVPENAHYRLGTKKELYDQGFRDSGQIKGMCWYNVNGDRYYLDYFDTFEKNIIYYAFIFVVPEEGYMFSDDTTATVNGEEASISSYERYARLNSRKYETAESDVKLADYSKVREAAEKIPADDFQKYTKKSVNAVIEAVKAVEKNLDSSKQAEVDEMAEKINEAVSMLRLKGEIISDVTLSSKYFTQVNATTYKYTSKGKQVNAEPVVRNSDGEKLVKNTDYKVSYSSEKRVLPGKYTITVSGTDDYKGTAELTLIITPEAAEGLKVRPSTGKGGYDDAFLSWTASKGASGYQVYARRPSKTSKWTFLGRTAGTSFTEKNLYDGYRYDFKVIPYVKVNDTRYRTTEDYSRVYMYTMKKAAKPSVKKSSSSKVKISWKDISGESGYQVMASRAGKTSYFRTSDKTIRLSVAKNKTYTYKVRAYKNVKKSGKTYRVYAPWSDGRKYTLK